MQISLSTFAPIYCEEIFPVGEKPSKTTQEGGRWSAFVIKSWWVSGCGTSCGDGGELDVQITDCQYHVETWAPLNYTFCG